jgi:hypothetical protein
MSALMGDGLKRAASFAKKSRLSDEDRTILKYLLTQPDGVTPIWIAERFGHFYQSERASLRLKRFMRNGWVSRPSRGWYVLTDLGRDVAR